MSSGKFSTIDVIIMLSISLTAFIFQDYTKLRNQLKSEAQILNNTEKANQTFVIFNRVPKAGTNTLWELLDAISKRQNFKFTSLGDSALLKDKRGENTIMYQSDTLYNTP